jgi:hypothetical protein
MSYALTPLIIATDDSLEKSTSHNQLMSRPSAYWSLMAIIVAALGSFWLAKLMRKPLGFFTKINSSG